jgi:L-iditol 2-dehydrogenase
MRAAVFHGPEDIRLEEVPDPVPGDDDVVVEVTACGICGSDLEYYTGASPLGTPDGKGPLVLGHEIAGRVVATGRAVGHVREGDRVALNPVQSSHSTDVARSGTPNFDTSAVLGTSIDGGLARFVRARGDTAHLLPDGVSDAEGAFVEPLASAVNAVETAGIRLGDFVVVHGPGPVGLAVVQLAKLRGAVVLLVGTRDERLDVGRRLGADHVVNVADTASDHHAASVGDAVREHNGGRPADRAIVVTSDTAAAQEALDVTGEGSTIVYMGLAGPDDTVSLPLLASLVAAKTVAFSWLYPLQWPKTVRLLERGLVQARPILTHSLPLERVDDAVALVRSRADHVLKVVLAP